jgi:hypothetical protein
MAKNLMKSTESLRETLIAALALVGIVKPKGIRLLNRRQTLDYVLLHKCSVSRFGDGESAMALDTRHGHRGIHFQKAVSELSERLSEVLFHPIDNLLVCFNNTFTQQCRYRVVLDYERATKNYSRFLSVHRPRDVGVLVRGEQRFKYLRQYIHIGGRTTQELFGDATCFSLCYFYDEYQSYQVPEIINLYKRMFEGRRIVIVCPEKPNMGASFQELVAKKVIRSPRNVEFIVIPDHDCYDKYDEIKKGCADAQSVDAVFIQAGPVGTVLAADLTEEYGMLAYDVGSMNVSLERAASVNGATF